MTGQPAPRMMTPHLVRQGFLSGEERAGLLDWTLGNAARFTPTGVKGGVDAGVRQSLSLHDLGPMRAVLKRRLGRQAAAFAAELGAAPFVLGGIELELAAHNDGAFYRLHLDTALTQAAAAHSDRILSGVYYFHSEAKAFSGGCLRLHRFGAREGDEGQDVAPDQNSLVVFPSSGPHEVRPVACPSGAFADSRFTVNCWLHRGRDGASPAHGM